MTPVSTRFWEKVDRSGGPNVCWPWTGGVSARGYGRFRLEGRNAAAHRVAWRLAFGVIPEGLFVCHRCDNPPCVNPKHLWLGTNRDNMLDMAAKGRSPMTVHPESVLRGERSYLWQHPERGSNAKLSLQDVRDIRAAIAGGVSTAVLATQYGLSRRSIQSIRSRGTYSRVD